MAALPSSVQQVIRDYQFRFKKRFGQNFLGDRNILNRIAESADLKNIEYVLEIGTGLGTLTVELAKKSCHVVTIEVDYDLVEILQDILRQDNITVISGDALELDWRALLLAAGWRGETVTFAGNLPYYLTTPLIMRALEGDVRFRQLVVMVQKEVAQRIAAEPGSKDYGILSLAVRYHADITTVMQVSRRAFVPSPDVDSTVIRLDTVEPPVSAPREPMFFVIRAAFGQRRKTLRNCLKPLARSWGISDTALDSVLAESPFDSRARGETLSLQDFSDLTEKLLIQKPS